MCRWLARWRFFQTRKGLLRLKLHICSHQRPMMIRSCDRKAASHNKNPRTLLLRRALAASPSELTPLTSRSIMGKEKFSPSETLPSQNHEPSAAPSESPSANPNRSQPSSSPDEEASELSDRHTLSSNRQGESEIEVLADRIESRRENRIPVPFRIQKNILKEFHHISEREGYTDHARIHYEDLVSLRETIEKEPPSIPSFLKKFGFICDRDLKLEIFDRAENFMEHFHMKEDGWFYYRDFMVSALRWRRCASRMHLGSCDFSPNLLHSCLPNILVLSHDRGSVLAVVEKQGSCCRIFRVRVLLCLCNLLLPHCQ